MKDWRGIEIEPGKTVLWRYPTRERHWRIGEVLRVHRDGLDIMCTETSTYGGLGKHLDVDPRNCTVWPEWTKTERVDTSLPARPTSAAADTGP